MNRRLACVLLLFAAAAIGAAFLFRGDPEPEFGGKSLTTLLSEARYGNPEAINIIRHAGTNSLPALVKMLQDKDPWLVQLWTKGERKWYERKHLGSGFIGAMEYVYAEDERCRFLALHGFVVLGPVAKPAVPELVELLGRRDTVHYAVPALLTIGPEGAPALSNGLASTNAFVRSRSADLLCALVARHTNDAVVIPAAPILAGLKDHEGDVRAACTWLLGKIEVDPNLAVPALTERLDDSFGEVRAKAAISLIRFGSAAEPATPKLIALLNDTEYRVREAATNSLRQINPTVGSLNR